MSERDIIIGAPISRIAGSKPFTCEDCGVEVKLAPSGQRLQEDRDLKVLCLTCGLEAMQRDGQLPEPLAPDQVDEIVNELRGVHPWG